MIVGAGSSIGSLDVANILKPAISNGEIKIIGATTEKDYRKFIERDPALDRRFQPIQVNEPSQQESLEILRATKKGFEEHYGVVIKDEALQGAIYYSALYMKEQKLPDKALDILEEACAKVKYGDNISFHGDSQEDELTLSVVTSQIIKDVISEKVNVISEKNLYEEIRKRIIGQDQAVRVVVDAIQRHKAGLDAGDRPVGVFMFLGPTGVGKTELSKAISQVLFGTEKKLIRIDMSEYMEKHNVSRLIGAPPGYIGYDEGGVLSVALKKQPFSVILLDEIDKAHPDVLNLFLQIFGEGRLTDGQGHIVDATNVVFIMTSNFGYSESSSSEDDKIFALAREKLNMPPENRNDILLSVKRHFKPEFLNRVDEVILFEPLSEVDLQKISVLQLEALQYILKEKNLRLDWSSDVVVWLAKKAYDPNLGARPLKKLIDQTIKNLLANLIVASNIHDDYSIMLSICDDRIKVDYSSPETI